MKKAYTEIEEIIENRIAKLNEDYELDRFDIREIRLKAYKENGWSYDPFPEDEEEEEEEEPWDPDNCHYRTMYDLQLEAGMGYWAFF